MEAQGHTPCEAIARRRTATGQRPSGPAISGRPTVSGRAKSESAAAVFRPILKWAGGKGRLAPTILQRLPQAIDTYYEPFLGGGAIFFALASSRRFRRAVLGDLNGELIEVYRVVKRDVQALIRCLETHQSRHCRDYYYEVRGWETGPLSSAERAARLIYLNKTGYNGLYRVNRSGQFNVPFGRYANPAICDEEKLRAASRALRGVKLEVTDFRKLSLQAKPGDAVYFDPPYDPVSKTASFTAYHREVFGKQEHEQLACTFRELSERSVHCVLSNSRTPFTCRLYRAQEFRVQSVSVARAINSQARARGSVQELLVSTRVDRQN